MQHGTAAQVQHKAGQHRLVILVIVVLLLPAAFVPANTPSRAHAAVLRLPQSQMEPSSSGGGSALQGPTRQILRSIYHKWQRQVQRWADYRSLFSLMAFIAVFMGVLYAQRGATVGYQVHSTIASVVMPSSAALQSTADVYSWLQNLLQVRGGWWLGRFATSLSCTSNTQHMLAVLQCPINSPGWCAIRLDHAGLCFSVSATCAAPALHAADCLG